MTDPLLARPAAGAFVTFAGSILLARELAIKREHFDRLSDIVIEGAFLNHKSLE